MLVHLRAETQTDSWTATLIAVNPDSGELHHKQITVTDLDTPQSRLDLMALIVPLQQIKYASELDIVSSSPYVMAGLQRNLALWRQSHWRTKAGTEVKNRDLWQRLAGMLASHTLVWDKQHLMPVTNRPVSPPALSDTAIKARAIAAGRWTICERPQVLLYG